MTVQIIINGESAKESLQELSTLAAGFKMETVASEPVETDKPKRQPRKTEPEKAKEEKQAEPATEAEEEDDLSFDTVPVPTDIELRALASTKAKSAGKEAVKALLDKFEVPNVTGVPDNKRVAFMKELEELD